MNIVLSLRFDPDVHAHLIEVLRSDNPWAEYAALELPDEFDVDRGYYPVDLSLGGQLSGLDTNGGSVELVYFLIRGKIVGDIPTAFDAVREQTGHVESVEIDPVIEPCAIPTVDPIRRWGTADDVKTTFSNLDETGEGVYICLVDTGINEAYLNHFFGAGAWGSRLRGNSSFLGTGWEVGDRIMSQVNGPRRSNDRAPFSNPLGANPGWRTWQADPHYFENSHGTMMAFDAALLAPDAILVDLPMLQSETFESLLTDVTKAYNLLAWEIIAKNAMGKSKVVVNNSWQLKNPSKRGARAYNQPFSHINNQIRSLASQFGVDFVFAAGNCGWPGECTSLGYDTIYGANSHPDVLTVGACNLARQWVSISSSGYGWLTKEKPDICCYSHFEGSGVKIYREQSADRVADGGTSAAAAVASGLVAALRQTHASTPAALRNEIKAASRVPGHPPPPGYNRTMGWGIPNP